MPKKMQNTTPNTIIVGDTSALISLAVGRILSNCLKIVKILIPEQVRLELEEMETFEDLHALAAEEILQLIEHDKISVYEVKNIEKVNHLISSYSRIDKGEAEALVLAQERSISILITDDFRSLRDLKKERGNVEIHLSTYLLARLVLEGKITKDEAVKSLSIISEIRTWRHAAIFELAKKYIEDLLR